MSKKYWFLVAKNIAGNYPAISLKISSSVMRTNVEIHCWTVVTALACNTTTILSTSQCDSQVVNMWCESDICTVYIALWIVHMWTFQWFPNRISSSQRLFGDALCISRLREAQTIYKLTISTLYLRHVIPYLSTRCLQRVSLFFARHLTQCLHAHLHLSKPSVYKHKSLPHSQLPDPLYALLTVFQLYLFAL